MNGWIAVVPSDRTRKRGGVNWESHAKDLQRQLDDLEFRLESLEGALSDCGEVVLAGLSPTENRICQILRIRSPNVVFKQSIFDGVYVPQNRSADEDPHVAIIGVWICKIRSKLDEFGVGIKTHPGLGYSMPKESAERWDESTSR